MVYCTNSSAAAYRKFIRSGIKAASAQQAGFTLVELLIVVIILALLAGVVVPQFGESSDDARLAALKANLAIMREAISRYKVEHPRWPGKLTSMGASCSAGGAAGSGLVNSGGALSDQLTRYTDINGRSCSTRDNTFRFGPYLREDAIPPNPMSGSNTVAISTAGDLNLTSARVDGQGGWLFDVWSGKLVADDPNFDHL